MLKFPGFEELSFRANVVVTSKIMAKQPPQTPKDACPDVISLQRDEQSQLSVKLTGAGHP